MTATDSKKSGVKSPRLRKEYCPNKENHTKHPDGYLEYANWAEEMMKTHYQVKCPGCDLYEIWLPKVEGKLVND